MLVINIPFNQLTNRTIMLVLMMQFVFRC